MESGIDLLSPILLSMAGKENADAVRIALRDPPAARRGRTLDERLYVRFPSLLPRLVSAFERLRPRSRIRQALLARSVQRGWAASDRGDLALALCGYDPDVEIRWPATGAIAFPDLKGVYRGHEGFRQVWRTLHDPWDVEVHLEEVIDASDRMLVTGHATGRGKGSGIEVDAPFFVLYSFRAGRIISEQYFNGRDEAFEAAGLKE